MGGHYAVFGHPVAHSLSPRIHAAFARQAGIALEYTAIDAAPAEFATALDAFAAAGGIGANVTLPLKEAAFALCRSTSERARTVVATSKRNASAASAISPAAIGKITNGSRRSAIVQPPLG